MANNQKEVDISSLVIRLEDPEYIEATADEPSYASFYVAMYDDGIQAALDRVGFFDNSDDYNSLNDIIEDNEDELNIYLYVDKNTNATLQVGFKYGDYTNVPLTEHEHCKRCLWFDRLLLEGRSFRERGAIQRG